MARPIFLLLLAVSLRAAVIRGMVVENQTSRALSHAVVVLEPVAGTPGKAVSAGTNGYGSFEFGGLAPGSYLVKASRRGFRQAAYGQKQWNSAARPLVVAADDATFLTIRLPRYGAITGTVVDQNDVGIAQQKIVAYHATQPPELAGSALTDERGSYRIYGLDPGKYLVRTATNRDDDTEYLPTFSRETLRADEAQTLDVRIDEDTHNVDLRPIPGNLLTISGAISPPVLPAVVTLASDTGRQSLTIFTPQFEFSSLAPGPHELYVEAPVAQGDSPRWGAYVQLRLERSMGVPLVMQQVRETRLDFIPARPNTSGMQLLARRKDYGGVGPVQSFPVASPGPLLMPGRWEVMLQPGPGSYVSAFSGSSSLGPSSARSRPDLWSEALIGSFSALRFTLSQGTSEVHGVVKAASEPVPGAPVYLEIYDTLLRKRLAELRTTLTDVNGTYRFSDLPPGAYRLLATFEYEAPDSSALDAAGARLIEVPPRADVQADLDLYGDR